ncbi:uncharacterized protein isoform X2 [Choristoneura fumiferana]|uniref:uncharacterized protein isoform X2 n=1 Tax=Choristoneura fumiferana TaxID=7141 RepID=UPI003D15A3D2
MALKSDFLMLLRWLVVVNIVVRVRGSLLGEQCRSAADCASRNAHCESGRCVCDPYYAKVDNSTCLESTLLGSECVVSEQCTLKVAYSACLEGVCRCTDGHLQFRKHTCLSPAPPGHVCYSNEHCRLWDRESHCEFVIPNLFGRCSCNAFYRLTGDKCVAQKAPTYVTEAVVAEQEPLIVDANGTIIDNTFNYKSPTSPVFVSSSSGDNKGASNTITDPAEDVKPSNLPMFTNKNEILSTQEDSPLMQAVMKVPEPSKKLPVSNRKEGDPNETIGVGELTANLHANDQPIYRVVTQPSVEKKSNKKSGTSKDQQKPYKTGHQKKSSLKDKHRIRADSVVDMGPASLGMPCLTDSQCHLVDPYTRCVNKRCDCAYRTNSTSACSARNRGCLPGTFQCRSTGACISWYFVCDGRKDCPDGSDETCQDGTGERCPMHAFRCGGVGSRCVSRAARCDGTPQCPGGEDERNCRATRRKGCPRHTFRCGSGECLPEYEFCNAIVSCKDASDEPPHLCNEQSRWRAADFCPLRCGNGRCRSTAVACSGRDGCGDNSDEIACSVCSCPAPQQTP